jgi:hypothetical protein
LNRSQLADGVLKRSGLVRPRPTAGLSP